MLLHKCIKGSCNEDGNMLIFPLQLDRTSYRVVFQERRLQLDIKIKDSEKLEQIAWKSEHFSSLLREL